jgi:hypothetical protein
MLVFLFIVEQGLGTPQRGRKMSAQGSALGLWRNSRMRPKGAKDMCFSAFALTERHLPRHFNTQGAALG